MKGLLLDIDNTIYDYDLAHEHALKAFLEFSSSKLGLSQNEVLNFYNKARKKVHIELLGTASSHNRLLYFQKLCELLNINILQNALEFYNIYWDNFLENMVLYDGVFEIFQKYNEKICIITDLTAQIQYRKIQKLKLDIFSSHIISSEEAGVEKPHPYIFLMGLKKLNLKNDEVYMLGDSFKKDIIGARNLDIKAIWLNTNNKEEIIDKNTLKINEFKEVLNII